MDWLFGKAPSEPVPRPKATKPFELLSLEYEGGQWYAKFLVSGIERHAWSDMGIVWRYADSCDRCGNRLCGWLEERVTLKERQQRLQEGQQQQQF